MKVDVNAGSSLELVLNLAKYHREHEKFYAQAPLRTAIELHRASRTLKTLADRWAYVKPDRALKGSRWAGCEDLNETATIQHDGVLFMEGGAEPAELERMKRDLATVADDFADTGEWLAGAMEGSWEVVRSLLQIPRLSDVLGERHRIVANDWQAAQLSTLVARLLHRALEILQAVDFTPKAVRADLAGARFFPGYLYSAAELVDRAADLAAESAALIHDNERRWRVFRRAAVQLRDSGAGDQETRPFSEAGQGHSRRMAEAVQRALEQHPMTAEEAIEVTSRRGGSIVLAGRVATEDKRQVAKDVAYAQEGIREVVDELTVQAA